MAIKLKFIDKDKEPLKKKTIYLECKGGGWFSERYVETDPEGKAEITGYHDPSYEIEFKLDGYLPWRNWVSNKDYDLNVIKLEK